MYRMVIVTAIGNYRVEMTPDKEEPDNNDLLKMFLDTKNDIESGAFMEGWTPEEKGGPPGVFAIAPGLDILAYHVEKEDDIIPPGIKKEVESELAIRPITLRPIYLGNHFICKGVTKVINDVEIIFMYEVNGETPTDVLEEGKLVDLLNKEIRIVSPELAEKDYLLQIANDGKTRNFSQATEMLEVLEENYGQLVKEKTGKAWSGWKGDA